MHKNKKELQPKKTVVIGMVNRESGIAKLEVIDNTDKESLLPKIGCNIKEKSVIVTDSYHAYNDLKNNFTHKSVKHSVGEYVGNELDLSRFIDFISNTNGKLTYAELIK